MLALGPAVAKEAVELIIITRVIVIILIIIIIVIIIKILQLYYIIMFGVCASCNPKSPGPKPAAWSDAGELDSLSPAADGPCRRRHRKCV